MNLKNFAARALLAFGFGAAVTMAANATPIVTFNPIGTSPNVMLSGLNLTSNSLVKVRYLVPALSVFGSLKATYSFSATETGAIAFGPLALGSFDGNFSLTYSGPNITRGTKTIHTGADLLSGTFLGSVLTGYGTSATLVDSIVAGGLVSFNDNKLLTFAGVSDEGMSLSMTGLSSPVLVSAGQLSSFTGVESGSFSATGFASTSAASRFSSAASVPEPISLSLFGAGLAGAAAMRRRRRKLAAAAVIASALSIVGTTGANATPIATYGPVDGTLDMNLTGLTLSDSRPMIFNYQLPGLANFGDLASNFSLNATETGAIAFGPIALASFDGSFSFAYAGPDITVGSVTIHTGDDLLSGSFLGSVLTGYGSTAGLVDSVLGGGLVSFNNNSFVTFTGLGDEALSMSLTDLSSPTVISAGALSPFSGNSQGIFSADEIATNACGNSGDLCKIPPTNVPEPFTFTLFGAGFVAAMRRRKQRELTR